MFEKYGFFDLFCALRRNYVKVLIVTVMAFVLGMVFGIVTSQNEDDFVPKVKHEYINSASFYFSYEEELPDNENALAYLKQAGVSASAYIKSDFAHKYVLNYLEKNYPKDYIIEMFKNENTGFKEEKHYNIEYISKYVKSNLLEDGFTINYWITTENEELTKLLFEGYASYVDYMRKELYTDLRLVSLGGAEQVIEKDLGSVIINSNPVKYGMVAVVCTVVLQVLFIFVVSLVFPAMNRRSDFTNYNVDIISEIKKNDKENASIDAQQYLRVINKISSLDVISIASTITDNSEFNMIVNKIQELSKDYDIIKFDEDVIDYENWYGNNIKENKKCIIVLPTIVIYETALQIAKKSDGFVLVEKYGKTKYKVFERVIELINENNIRLKGIIAVK